MRRVLALPAGVAATAPENVHGPPEIVELFAKALRFVHEVPIERCPFSNRLDIRLRSIQRKLRAGRYDGMQLSEAYRRYPPTRLFEILNETQADRGRPGLRARRLASALGVPRCGGRQRHRRLGSRRRV